MRDTDIMFGYVLTVFVGAIVVLGLKNYNTEYVNYYPYAVVYEKGDKLNITTFTTVKPVSINMGSGVIKVDGLELDATKGATKILNVETLTPIISKE